MVTTIQLNEHVKLALDKMKSSKKDTYEDIIVKMIKESKNEKMKVRELLIEGYKEMAEESLKITKEWESTDAEMDKNWEW